MKIYFRILPLTLFLLVPMAAFAQTEGYTPLIQFLGPGGETLVQPSWEEYINILYRTAIALAALLAVVKIVIAGAKYMFSDVITNKSDAKNDIKGALLGLLLIIGAVAILELINPQIIRGGPTFEQIDLPEKKAPAGVQPAAAPSGTTPAPSGGTAGNAPTPAPSGAATPTTPAPTTGTTYTGSCSSGGSPTTSGGYTVYSWNIGSCPTSPVATNLDNMTPHAYYLKQHRDFCNKQNPKGNFTSTGKPGVYECKIRN